MTAYPVSLSLTAVLIFIALLIAHPSRRYASKFVTQKATDNN